jgi:hypothetical protein
MFLKYAKKAKLGQKNGDFITKTEILSAERENRLFLRPNSAGLQLVAVSR